MRGSRKCMCAAAFALGMMASHCLAQVQQAPASDKTSSLVDMLSNIKNAVQSGRYRDPSAVYKTVSVRLAECAITYGMLSGIPDNSQAAKDKDSENSQLYYRAATALYPGTADDFKHELEKSKERLIQLRSDKKALFYFVRNCRDLSQPAALQGAISELLL